MKHTEFSRAKSSLLICLFFILQLLAGAAFSAVFLLMQSAEMQEFIQLLMIKITE